MADVRRRTALAVIVSCVLLIPCFWQPAIQAGDLASHVYNGWLYRQVRAGSLEGLAIVPRYTNVLWDRVFAVLWDLIGLDLAQRMTVAITVLAFFWGAVALLRSIVGRVPWEVLPVIAMLAFGSIFQIGFLNFLLGLGLAMAGAALVLSSQWRYRLFSLPCFALAVYAHVLGLVWPVGVATYVLTARKLSERGRRVLLAATVGGLVIGHLVLTKVLGNPSADPLHSLTSPLALHQFSLYAPRYYLVAALVWILWLVPLLLMKQPGRWLVSETAGHVLLITLAGAALSPSALINLPLGYRSGIWFLGMRAGLAVALAWCAVTVAGRPPRWIAGVGAVAASFFFFLFFFDQSMANALESDVGRIVRSLPRGARVAGVFRAQTEKMGVLEHVVDRACIGHCYAYLNYEPSSRAFLVVATHDNPYVISSWTEIAAAETAGYEVKPRDLPFFEVRLAKDLSSVSLRSLQVGDRVKPQEIELFPGLW